MTCICLLSNFGEKDMENRDVELVNKSELLIYQPDEITKLEVRLDNDTVWLTQSQMSELFQRNQSVIARHIRNIFEEQELDKDSNMQILHNTLSKYKPVSLYSLDVIISVGYRVKSLRGTLFRQWANRVLKEYLLKGVAIHHRMALFEKHITDTVISIQDNINQTLSEHEQRIDEFHKKLELFVHAPQIMKQGIFYDGQVYDAYAFVAGLVRRAVRRIVLIDNYIDETVLTLLDKRAEGVESTIYTSGLNKQLRLDIARHNSQYLPIDVKTFSKAHDRFLVIDDEVYLIGASIKDLGKKWFGFTLMENTSATELLSRINH